MHFTLISKINDVQVIAVGRAIREIERLRKLYGGRRWRKLKGVATILLADGTICDAELHWYEAHGVGKKEMKIKQLL